MSEPQKKRWALPHVDPQDRRKVIQQPAGAASAAYCKSCQPIHPAPQEKATKPTA